MLSIKRIVDKILHPTKLIYPLGPSQIFNWMPDKMYCSLAFRGEMGYRLDLNAPKTFNEKLQWLKLYDRRSEYTDMVDKLSAKTIVGKTIGFEHIVKTYGIWDRADKIQFESLPDRFVLKCNHDQGSVVLVSDKSTLDTDETIKKLNMKLRKNLFYETREYPYKNIIPKVFAEEYLENDIIDYKFYCFNGEPKFLYCGQGLTEDHSLKIDFYDLNWNLMPFYRTDYHRLGQIEKPKKLSEMIGIARKLSKGVPFVRIDLFEVDGKVYFSEFTLCPASGYMPFVPKEYDRIVGDWLELPVIK